MKDIAKRVAARFNERVGMEHDSPEALKEYLKEHPNADKSNHTVKKKEDGGKKKETKPKQKSPHSLRDEAEAALKAGKHEDAALAYLGAAERFKQEGMGAAAKSMEDAARDAMKKGQKKKKSSEDFALSYRVAARHLEAEMGVEAPKKVDDLFDEVKKGNPDYSDEQAWATAWSIYCKHVDPNGSHCHKSPGDYLKEAADMPPTDADDGDWDKDEKRGEWNLILHQYGSRISAFMKNPSGGGGGGNRYPSLKAAVKAEIARTGWGSPHVNPTGKDKVWVVLRVYDAAAEDYVPKKQWWVEVPRELFKAPGAPTKEQHWEMMTR